MSKRDEVADAGGSFISNQVCQSELKPGDHIYAWRTLFTYAHHGIYIGDNRVIGFTSRAPSHEFSSFSSVSSHKKCKTFPECGEMKSNNNTVVKTCLDCFLKGSSIYRFNYSVSRLVRWTRIIEGTCSTKDSDPPKKVVDRAEYLLANGFGDYDLTTNNCEGFAFYCKTELVIVPLNTPNLKRHHIKMISGQTALGGAKAKIIKAVSCKKLRIPVEDLLLILRS